VPSFCQCLDYLNFVFEVVDCVVVSGLTHARRHPASLVVLALLGIVGCGPSVQASRSVGGVPRTGSGSVTPTATTADVAMITTAAVSLDDLPGYWTVASPWSADDANQLAQDRVAPGCQPVSLTTATTAEGRVGFTLSVDPGNHESGHVVETIMMTTSSAAASAEHAYTRSPSWLSCVQPP
jgi:hypothetical protein